MSIKQKKKAENMIFHDIHALDFTTQTSQGVKKSGRQASHCHFLEKVYFIFLMVLILTIKLGIKGKS